MPYHFVKKIPLLAPLLNLVACSMPAPKSPVGLEPGDYQHVKNYMRWYINKQMKKQDIAGLSVALVDDQTIVWQQGFGYADKEAGKMNIDQPLKNTYRVLRLKAGLAIRMRLPREVL